MNDDLPPDLAAAAALLQRAATDEAAPPAVLARVLALAGPAELPAARLWQAGKSAVRSLVALLAPPQQGAGLGLAPAWGVRGALGTEGHWLYQVEDFEIDLRTVLKGEAWSVSGQLFGMDQASHVTLETPDQPAQVQELGPTREFKFAGLQPGRYKLTVAGGDCEVVVPQLDLGQDKRV